MLLTGSIIAGCLYNLGKELYENHTKKTKKLATHLKKEGVYRPKDAQHPIVEMATAITGSGRKNQLQEFVQTEKSKAEKMVDRNIAISAGMLGTSIVGTFFFPPLLWFILPAAAYIFVPIFLKAYRGITQEKKIVLEVADVVFEASMFLLGYYILGSLDALLYFTYRKLALKTEDQSKQKLVNMADDLPQTVWLVKRGVEIEVPLEKLKHGEVISVSAGQMIPVDGVITHGLAMIDERMLTGESQAAEKKLGDICFASTLILEGNIHIQVKKIGQETVAFQIGEALNKSLDYRDEVIAKGQEVSDKSTVPALMMSAASLPFVGWAGSASVLLANYGYNIRAANPVIVLNYLLIASQEGILIKDGRALEVIHQIDTVVFDKTGTLTLAQPSVKNIYANDDFSETDILKLAAAAEHKQSHPIALAILEEAQTRRMVIPSIEHTKYDIGYGLKVEIEGQSVLVGSVRYMEMQTIAISEELQAAAKAAHLIGNTFVYVAINQELGGAIELSPTIRPEARTVVKSLQEKGIDCYIISGDHTLPTRYLARELGIRHYFAEVLPEEKADLVERLQNQGKKVGFIGDGINDSIALKKANVSISMRGATTLATDTAQIILLDETLSQIPLLFELGQQFNQRKDSNLFSAVTISALTISGVLFLKFGLIAAVISNQLSLLTGFLHSLQPLLHYHDAKKQIETTEDIEPEEIAIASIEPELPKKLSKKPLKEFKKQSIKTNISHSSKPKEEVKDLVAFSDN